ncbi:MAG: 6,7-dimethyl-8-ribityllumazine synthase [Planctomycetes bacterium]|nr:6,7-dimethyl-8-ribityllumazine synthase [Planctomycetota bacterium]
MASSSIAGDLHGEGRRFAIAAGRFNGAIVEQLVAGAIDALVRHGVKDTDIVVARCPGAWELPLLVKKLAASAKYDAIVALGCVIRGETPHFDYVAGECAKGLAAISLASEVPVSMGVLTTDTTDQAQARAGLKAGNKGVDAALAALEMVNLLGGI